MSDGDAPSAPRLPVRAAWAWPLAMAAIAFAQASAAYGRQGGRMIAIGWAVTTGFALGAWLGLLHALLAFVLARRVVAMGAWTKATAWIPPRSILAASAVGALVVLLAAWWGIDVVYGLVRAHPLDYDAVGRQIWRGASALSLTVAAAILFVVLRVVETRLRDRPELSRRVGLGAATLVVAGALGHLSGGPFFVYFGSRTVLVLTIACAAIAAAWLPAAPEVSRRSLLRWGAPWLVLVGIGIGGLHAISVRALLLHDAPMFREVHAFATAWADGDGDGDLPPWLGGLDCDDGDPAVSGAAKEIGGNGIDDNCWAGDAPAPERAPVPATAPRRPAVVLVTIDTVRADHLELYGAERATMPALAGLGARGIVFERAYAPANHTFFSVTAMLAGQSTERMLVPGDAPVPQLSYTRWLPHVLGGLGYHRVAIDPPLLLDGKLRPEDLRFDEIEVGPFDWVGDNRGARSRQVADAAIRWLEGWSGDAPVFLWIHFMDPHAVHESPVRFAVQSESDAYDNELSWVDLHLSRVLAAVDATFEGRAEIVVTSDHGEQLGEAGGWGHGFSLREEEVRVPLVVAGPGLAPARVAEPVSTLRVPATVLHRLGLDPRLWPRTPSLLAEGDAPAVVVENPAFLWNERRMEAALVVPPYKLSYARTTNTTLLYDLEHDPHERDDLSAAEPEVRARMLQQLRDLLEDGA